MQPVNANEHVQVHLSISTASTESIRTREVFLTKVKFYGLL